MTTEQPVNPRLLRRRTDDRVIGGVASGLGDYLNVDPLLIRIGFVGLMVFGGLGLLLYVGGWLLVPEEGDDDSIVEDLLHRTGLTPTRWLVLLVFALGMIIFFGGVGNAYGFGLSDLAIGFGIAIMVIVLGGGLLSYSGRLGTIPASPAASQAPSTAATARPVSAPRSRSERRRRPRSPLGWYILGAMLAAIGLLALATNVSGAEVDLGQFFGVAMAAIGIGLVVGTWWGHARLLILLGLLLLPFAIVAAFITAPIEGGFGEHRFSPTSAGDLQDEYRLAGGRMVLDLTQIERGDGPIVISASVALGGLFVELPADAGLELDAAVGAGDIRILGAWQAGTNLTDRRVTTGDGPTFVLDLEAGIGGVQVDAPRTGDR
jgi:phage shock protein PspC (stress-responsive transcriptional regulator)